MVKNVYSTCILTLLLTISPSLKGTRQKTGTIQLGGTLSSVSSRTRRNTHSHMKTVFKTDEKGMHHARLEALNTTIIPWWSKEQRDFKAISAFFGASSLAFWSVGTEASTVFGTITGGLGVMSLGYAGIACAKVKIYADEKKSLEKKIAEQELEIISE